MIAHLQRSLSIFLALVLGLAGLTLSTPAPQVRSSQAQPAPETMPNELMSAFLEASSRPFEAGSAGYRAQTGGLDFTLGGRGLQANAAGIAWNLTLSGLGRGEQIAPVADADIVQGDDRLEYRRGALTEWYRSTALGLEQGFTIQQAPGGAGLLVLQMDLSTGLAGNPDADRRGLTFTAPGGQRLRYDHLRAWDANGAQLEAEMRYTPGQIALLVDDGGAVYPITVDPLAYREQRVIASGAPGDLFGVSVALYGDTALVGAYDDINGSAYVFMRSGTGWNLQQKLTASDGHLDDRFGISVALYGDTALVGAYWDGIGANPAQGSAYVFVGSGTTWTQQDRLIASDGAAGDRFGYSVALYLDTALVGAVNDSVGKVAAQGSAYVFVRSGPSWTQQAKLTADDGAANDDFGVSVALYGDTALVGADLDDVLYKSDQGSAYVFVRSGTTWTQQAKLIANYVGQADDRFGISVALSGDTALVGAYWDDSAYVFVRSGTSWGLQERLTSLDGAAGDRFGYSVALYNDTALVGAVTDTVGANPAQGSAYVFVRSGTSWTQQTNLTAADGAANDDFGVAVALYGDTTLVGADLDDVGDNSDQGSAYVFTRSGTNWTQQAQITGSDGAANDDFGYSVAISGDTALVGARLDDIGTNENQGSAYVFVRSGTSWNLQQKLTAPDGEANDLFGISVALSGNTALVGADGHHIGANYDQGSVYVFVRSGTTWSLQKELWALNGAANDRFGGSVAISGNTALVGASSADVGVNIQQGSAYIFERSGTTWNPQQKLTAPDGAANDDFGVAVAISGDTALVGADLDDAGSISNQGSAYVFVRSGTSWNLLQKLTAPDGAAADYFGRSVALSDSYTALVGAFGDDIGFNSDQGSVYVYVLTWINNWDLQQKLTASDGATYDWFGISVALSGNTVLVGAFCDNIGPNRDQGSAYVFVRNGTTWTKMGKLTASDGVREDLFGASVALSGDGTALVGAYGDHVGNFSQGSAYFFSDFEFSYTTYLPLDLRPAP